MAEAGRGARAAGAEASVQSAVGAAVAGGCGRGSPRPLGPGWGAWRNRGGWLRAGGRGRGGVRVAKTLEMEDEGRRRTARFKPW